MTRDRQILSDFQKRVQRAEELCKPNDRIKLTKMGGDDPDPVVSGSEGKVIVIDGAGTTHINWDNGRGIGLIPDVNQFEVITEGQTNAL